MAAKKETSVEVQILKVDSGQFNVRVFGTTPFIFNRMSEKAKRQLLLPAGQKTKAEKASSLKHDPPTEFRDSVYQIRDESCPTLFGFPCSGFKGSMSTAAKELDVYSTKVDKLINVTGPGMRGNLIPIYGAPLLMMSVVRSADQNKTPDIRTRAILPRWCCELTIHFIRPQFVEQTVSNLLAGAGLFVGVGDYRQEKGSGNYGLWKCDPSDAEWKDLIKSEGRRAQMKGIDNPVCYDAESEEMLTWFHDEVQRRGRQKQLSGGNGASSSRRNKSDRTLEASS